MTFRNWCYRLLERFGIGQRRYRIVFADELPDTIRPFDLNAIGEGQPWACGVPMSMRLWINNSIESSHIRFPAMVPLYRERRNGHSFSFCLEKSGLSIAFLHKEGENCLVQTINRPGIDEWLWRLFTNNLNPLKFQLSTTLRKPQ